jgi:hypothetical protein
MRLFLLFAITFVSTLSAKESSSLPAMETLDQMNDEITQLELLIKATEDNLARQKHVRSLLQDYKKLETACIEKPNNTPMLFKMAHAGCTLYAAIDENYFTDYFRPEFIDDLKKLKAIADKKNIPPAK